ncbi:MAG TPA: VWA domain-containing protein [Candidatus Angelobacter sp.]
MGRLLPISLFLLVCIYPGSAQQAPYTLPLPQQDNPENSAVYKSATVLKYTSRLILVDVIASDHKGDPVRDLKAEDFTLTEDGDKQELRVFEFQAPPDSSTVRASAVATPLPKPADNVFTNAPRYNVTRALNVLLLDALNSKSSNQTYAREQMIKFLEKLPPGQPFAVYVLGSRLSLLQDFTSDPAVLKKVITNLKGQASPVLNQPAANGRSLDQLPAGAALEYMSMFPQMLAQVRQFQQDNIVMQDDFRLRLSLAAMNSLARTLAGYPGRKNLIWLSESFPLSVLPNNTYPQSGEAGVNAIPAHGLDSRDYTADVARTTSMLTDAQVAVYPVDIRALVGNEFYSSLSNTSQSTGDYLGRVTTARSSTATGPAEARNQISDELNVTSNELLAVHSTMNELADRTGGKAYYNRNEVESAIRRTIDDGSVYYTLGYYPANKDWNGKFRKINVKVQRSGIKLHYRVGYLAMDPQAYAKLDANQRAAEFGQALSLEFPASTALVFQARVFPPSAQTNNKVRVSFTIDPHQISFEQADGLQHASVDCAIAAYTVQGEPIKAEGGTSSAALKPEPFATIMNSFFPCQRQLALPPGEYLLRLGVRDNRTGLIGTVNGSVTVPPLTAQPIDSK